MSFHLLNLYLTAPACMAERSDGLAALPLPVSQKAFPEHLQKLANNSLPSHSRPKIEHSCHHQNKSRTNMRGKKEEKEKKKNHTHTNTFTV